MAPTERPDNWQDLAAGYVLNNLDDEEQKVWEQLIAQHPEWAEDAESLQVSWNALADTVPMETPPARMLDRIHARIEAGTDASSHFAPVVPGVSLPSAPSSPALDVGRMPAAGGQMWRRCAQVGGAIALGIIAILALQLRRINDQYQVAQAQLDQRQAEIVSLTRELRQAEQQARSVRPVVRSLQQPGTLTYSLAGSNLAATASGQLVLSATNEVLIIVRNLPTLDEGQVYRLWAALPQETGLLYCGQFQSNDQGIIQLTPSSQQCSEQPDQMIITLDAITDPTTQGGPVVLQGAI